MEGKLYEGAKREKKTRNVQGHEKGVELGGVGDIVCEKMREARMKGRWSGVFLFTHKTG